MDTRRASMQSAAVGLVPGVVRLLAEHGLEAVPEVLRQTARAVACAEIVLRDETGAELARAWPGPVARQPGSEALRTLETPARAAGALRGRLTATSSTPFSAARAAALTAVADALALALAADASAWVETVRRDDAAQAVLDDEADRAQVAAALNDQISHALVALRYTAELVAAGQAGAAALDDPVRATLTAFRQAHRDLRAYALEDGLRAALAEVAARGEQDRPDDGQPMLRVEVAATDPALDRLAPPIAVTVQRVTELALRGATGAARVSASVDGETVKLRVDSADIACDASELGRWRRRVRTLGGDLRSGPEGVELSLPASTEGSHDDGPDL